VGKPAHLRPGSVIH